MKRPKSHACFWLTAFFLFGSAAGTALRARMSAIPVEISVWVAAVLTLDACMCGSLLAAAVLPWVTLFFGAAIAQEAYEILHGEEALQRLSLLLAVTPLHFAVSCGGLRIAERIRKALIGREQPGELLLSSILTAALALFGGGLTLYLAQRAP